MILANKQENDFLDVKDDNDGTPGKDSAVAMGVENIVDSKPPRFKPFYDSDFDPMSRLMELPGSGAGSLYVFGNSDTEEKDDMTSTELAKVMESGKAGAKRALDKNRMVDDGLAVDEYISVEAGMDAVEEEYETVEETESLSAIESIAETASIC